MHDLSHLARGLRRARIREAFARKNSPKLRHLFLSARAKFHLNLHSTEDIIIFPGNPARNLWRLPGS